MSGLISSLNSHKQAHREHDRVAHEEPDRADCGAGVGRDGPVVVAGRGGRGPGVDVLDQGGPELLARRLVADQVRGHAGRVGVGAWGLGRLHAGGY
jgi:hypothetical protein